MNKRLVAGTIIILFMCTSFVPSIGGDNFSCESDAVSSGIFFNEGSLSGYVTDASVNPIEGARVRVYFHETYEENYSDPLGYYHVNNIPICYCLKNATCSKEGYNTEWVLLSIDENTIYDFILTSLSVPDLDCEGDLAWGDVEPGETLTGSFEVFNEGDPGSLLDWEIESYPEWGTWTFMPSSGDDLKPEDGPLIVDVEVIAPDDPDIEFQGEVVVVNLEDPSDKCIVTISLDPFIDQHLEVESTAEKIITEGKSNPIFVFPIIGLYPNVSENSITFWMLTWITIPKGRFRGHMGESIIFGVCILGGPVL